MGARLKGWLIAALLLGTAVYAIAEEVTLTTYYPSPRGVYKMLRVGSGTVSSPTAKLQVTLPTAGIPGTRTEFGIRTGFQKESVPGSRSTAWVAYRRRLNSAIIRPAARNSQED